MFHLIKFFLSIAIALQFSFAPPPPYVQATVYQVERWRYLVEWYHDKYYPDVPVDLTLAIIAQESGGISDAISRDKWKSVGLMQVTPRVWVGTTEELLRPGFNVSWGMWFYQQALWQADGDYELALKAYNCGWERLKINPACGDYYVERVVGIWLPHFMQRDKFVACIGIHQVRICP